MLGITDLSTYLVGLVLIILLPGPNSLYVLSVAARRGSRDGFRAAAGVWSGDAVLMTLSAAGVASLLKANDLAFSIVKYVGAGYLGYLAFMMLRGAVRTWRTRRATIRAVTSATPPGPKGTIRRSGLAGNSWAWAPAATRVAVAPRHRRASRDRIIVFLNSLERMVRPPCRPAGRKTPSEQTRIVARIRPLETANRD